MKINNEKKILHKNLATGIMLQNATTPWRLILEEIEKYVLILKYTYQLPICFHFLGDEDRKVA